MAPTLVASRTALPPEWALAPWGGPAALKWALSGAFLALAVASGSALAQQVALTGVLGGKALLVVDGAPPKVVAVGESYHEVKVVSVAGDVAMLETRGQRFSQRVGDSPTSVGSGASSGGGKSIVIQAGSGGHFMSLGRINGQTVEFMVDTGATTVSMSQQDAERMRLNYRSGQPYRASTANGIISGWQIKLDSVSVGDVTIYGVDASITPAPMPYILLGNSFLSRFQMRQENGQMTLTKNY
jgi:aspartyl protease family protein